MRRLAPHRPAARFSTAHSQHQHEAPKPPAAPLTPQEFCRQIVQQRDRDHYACTLFLPKKSQDAVFAVRALNVELASLRDVAKVRWEPFIFTSECVTLLSKDRRALGVCSSGGT